MTDAMEAGDPVERAIAVLRQPVAVEPGLAARTDRRRARQRVTRRIARGVTFALAIMTIGLATRSKASGTTVTFSIAAPNGRSVALVGDFNDWQSDRVLLERTGSGIWRATLTLPPGRYRFAYLIDRNQWRADSSAIAAPDDFGRPTSVLTVGAN